MFKYKCVYLKTGEVFEKECIDKSIMTYRQFLELINNWNRIGQNTWKYWAI